MDFKVGDYFVVTKSFSVDGMHFEEGDKGIIVKIGGSCIGTRWFNNKEISERNNEDFHNLSGLISKREGWYIYDMDLKNLKKTKLKKNNKEW